MIPSLLSLTLLLLATVACVATAAPRFAEVNVFNIGEAGYFCIKIPYLFTTANGTVLALAEARLGSCDGRTWTAPVPGVRTTRPPTSSSSAARTPAPRGRRRRCCTATRAA